MTTEIRSREGETTMRFRVTVTACAAASAVLLAAGCSSTPSSSAPGSAAKAAIPLLTGGEVTSYGNLDPDQTQSCNDNYCGLFMEHLLQMGPNYTLEPELATSVTQPNPLTYIYHLRHGVRFWDGHEMTSADVVYSLDYQSLPSSDVNSYFTNVKTIAADGPYTVVVTLRQPDAGWKYSLSYEGVIFEKSFALAHKGALGKPGVLIQATGPWELDSYDQTRTMELSANPHWWAGKVPIKHITVKFFSNETDEALAMRAGEIDLAFPNNGLSFASASGATVTTWSPPSVAFFAMNVTAPPWNDIHVRRAVAYALNRTDLIIANGGPRTATPGDSLIPPAQLQTLGTSSQVSTLFSALPQYPYSLSRARQEMAKSAYPHGFTATTQIDALGHDSEVAQVLSTELQNIGITLKVDQVTEAQYFNDFNAAPPGGNLYGVYYAASPDPSIFPTYLLGAVAAGNTAHYHSSTVNALLAAGLATSNPARRLSIYQQVLTNLATDVPYVPLFSVHNYTALSGKYTLPPFSVYPAFSSWALHLRLAA
jgi:peptide/nickel transport system substrate-binding protein